MKYSTVKFKFDFIYDNSISEIINNAKSLLNFQFDEDSHVFFIDDEVEYQIRDVSNLNSEDIEIITNSFFNFKFEDIFNVFLYKFLVLKNNDKFTILANIHPSIFNYALMNDFYELFNGVNGTHIENNLVLYYDDVKNYLDSSDYDNDSDYWENVIINASDYVKFHNLKSDNYKRQKIGFDNGSILSFMKKYDCSLFGFYASVFSLYISRINRQKGCLLKTNIPSKCAGLKTILKFDLDSDCSFADYLRQFNSIYDEAVGHTKVSIEKFMDENLSYYSIYDFSDLNENVCIFTGDDSALTLNIYDNYLEIVYNADLFTDIYIQHMADNIKAMINDVVEFPNHFLNDVNILSDNEEDLLSDFCRGDDADVDEDFLIARYFRRHALENPDAIAIDDGVNQVSYGELEKSSNSIAHDLFENYNISLESHVALILPRTYHFPEMVLALNKLGAIFIPIDTTYPVKRIKHMLEISEAECIVTTKDLAGKFDFDLDIIYVEDLNSCDEVDVEIVDTSENLFSIMFTSGTTGLPKGVKISNHQLVGLFESFKNIFSFSYGDLIGCYLSFSFIASYVIYLAFAFGGGCRIFNENEQKDILSLIRILKENPMNSLFLPPTLAIPILESGDIKLDYLVLAGGKLNDLSTRERSTQIINLYGTTEIVFGVNKVYDLKDIDMENLPIGRPVTNTNVYILDEHSNQMPIGVPGEICVSSDYISPGYYNNPDLTREVFVDNPYCDGENNKIMYRTGDIGFYNFEGDIEIMGREDDQLSVRGFRIESKEILNIVNSIPEIENVYLDVENDILALYFTTNAEIDIDTVKEKLMDELPAYMLPSLFMELDEIPLNMNGKIDKARLKNMSKLNAEIDIDDEVLAGIVDAFKEVLGTDLILVNDDFVELGGNSLSAMNLQILFKEKFNVNISSQEIIELSTPNNIAEYIKFNLKSSSNIEEIKYAFDEGCPLYESQLNIYLDESVNNMGTAYNNPFKIDFGNNYSVDKIKNALIKLFDVFPILKARVLTESDVSFVFDAEPEINEGLLKDLDSFVKPFEFDKYLSRFLIVDNDASVILCADFHHLIFDGTSLNIFLKKFLSVLNGEDIDFVDNGVLRQISFEEILDFSYTDDAREFFDQMLADREEVNNLLPSVDGGDEFEIIDTFDMDEKYLGSFLQNHNITYNQFFTSVFAYTLSRFAGSNKVLFNMIEDGRGHIDLSDSVGMFVKTLPVLIDCENQNVDSFLKYSSNLINSVMKYDLYPFHVLSNEYDLNSNILFQYSHNLFSDILNQDDLKYDVDELKHDLNADLSFYIFNNGEDKFTIRILCSSLYSEGFVEHFAESYRLILQEMLDVEKLSDISYVTESDIEILDSYNQTENTFEYDDVLDAFNDNLLKYENNTLVGYNDISYTYGEGAFIANEIANKLIDLGVVKQDYVSLFVNRSEFFLLAPLGVLSCGCIYVPIETGYPDERIVVMLEDTKSKIVIVDNQSEQRMKEIISKNNLDILTLNVSEVIQGSIGSSNHLNAVEVTGGDIACVLYTSGTTGTPKGTLTTKKALNNLISWYVTETNFTSEDVYGMHCSYVFDMHTFALFAPLITGGSLYVVPEDIKLDLKAFNEYFVSHNCTHTYITSQVGKLFAESGMKTTIKLLCFGGMKLGELNAPDSIGPFESYGPSENLAISTSIFANKRIHHSSIGRFISNVKGYVLDKEHRRVPLGAVGELYLSGHQLSPGYLNREKENVESFFDNPFCDDDNYKRIYKTGDLVRFLPDGTLSIIGRQDSQVKIRGNRVELTEVESVIMQLSFVEEVTVDTLDNDGNNELVAYVVVSDDADENNIRDNIWGHVSNNKPDYMVPSFIIFLDKIPLTVNGKVDKRALPEVDVGALRSEYVAPRNKFEKDIVNAFEEVFNQEKIGIYDDFTVLGGDSLSAIKVLAILGDYNLSAGDILSLRTPYAIADAVNKNNMEFDLDVYSTDSGCPLNEAQLNVYLDIVVNEKTDAYILPVFMELSKNYNLNEIIDALNKMFEVHPILNTCVNDEYDIPHLVRNSEPQIIVKSNADKDYILKFLTQPFDLHDSLCRFLVIENDNSYELYNVFHHIICDARSCAVFKENLLTILNGQSMEIDDSFLKVSAFTQQIKDSKQFIKATEFYDNMLVDCNEIDTLLDSIGADGPGSAQIDLDLDSSIFPNQTDINENVLFTSVFAYTLSRFTGNEKALFNIVENGRDRFNNFNAFGMYVNTLPLLVDCSDKDTSSFTEYMSSLIYEVQSYNYYPFRLLAKKYDIDANILFQFIPEWIDNDDNNVREVYDKLGIIRNINNLNADLTFEVIKKDNEYYLNVIYCDKYSNDFINKFIQSYKLILHGIINADKLSEINYILNDDVELLDSYNHTDYSLHYDDILDAFNDNLLNYPENKLVSYNNLSYSYAEGAFIASKIAESLTDYGVRSQDCVGFLVPRSELYMFSVLGILSAGAVYVPLDDDLPDERIEFILKDSDCKVVIVSDETNERLSNLNSTCSILNVSDILCGGIGSLTYLPVVYGDLACILYTSGTTGIPKGVKITRKSIVNVVEFYVDKYALTSNDVYALFSAIGFDVSNFVISAVLYSGCCLSIIPADIRFNMVEMNNYFIKHNVSHVFINTQVGKLFMQNVDDISLDVLLVAGEKLGDVENPSDYALVDGFGPTEAFAFVSSISNSQKITPFSVGYLNYNMKAYVLDNEYRRVPIGAVGELYLSGYQVADGYLNREEETKNAFIKNPFENTPGYDVLYRTGDMVRLLPDASLGLVGRRDSQVKIRGNRVELGEVEKVIRELDYINDVTVQTVKINDNYELVAYVVSDELDEDSVRNAIWDHVGRVKPDYMLPSFVICLDHIPLTVNNKVDRNALPEVDINSLSVGYVAPTNEMEEQIVSAFEVVFNQEGIGLNDDFTRLGGDSITAIRLISLLEKEGISCSARDILNYKTPLLIAQNAEKISKKSYDATIGKVDLLPIQSYFFNQINSNEFSQEFILKSKNNLDIGILQSAFDELTNVHDMLRATYKYDNDNVIQEILPLNTSVCKVKEYTTEDLNKTVKDIIDESKKSLDISNDLIKISLIHYDNDSYIVFVIHHLIIDGVSWSILIDDLTFIINQIKNNKEINLLRPYPYKNWVKDVKTLIENISDNEKQQWITINNILDDSLIKGVSKGFTFNTHAKFDQDNLLMISEEEYLALSIARAYKKTFNQNVIFNRESHGRDELLADVTRTVGWFTSQFPVLVETNNEYDTISLMRDVYNIKKSFNNVNHLGLNYESLIYTTNELEYKHCPVTFNFLSDEFSFENELFKSIYPELPNNSNLELVDLNHDSFGLSLNVSRIENHYVIKGEYADDTYLGDKFSEFIENIKYELEYIGDYNSDVISCCLSESQLGIYLDEKVNEMGTAYSTVGIFEYPKNKSVDEIENAVHRLIDKHPVLRGRVVDGDVPLLVCDSYPSIENIVVDDYSKLIKPFDLNKSLARFYIIENNNGNFVLYDIHHIISDATSRTIINRELSLALEDNLDDTIDLGFVYASHDSFNSQFESIYDESYEFYKNNLSDIDETNTLVEDINGVENTIRLPIHDIRENVGIFCHEYGITVSNFFNAVFAYTYSRFTGKNKVYYTFTENGRHEYYSEDAVGMFVRTIPIIINCENTSVNEYLSAVSDLILDSMKYSVYPFRSLAHEFDLNNNVSFEYNFDLNDVSDVGNELIIEDNSIDLISDFLCVVNNLDDGYLISIESGSKYSNDTIIRFLNAFNKILRGLLNCNNLSDINYISSDDLILLDEINDTKHDLHYDDILDAFNYNLTQHPDNPLVSMGNNSYSYAEGAFIADNIAKCLKNLGVSEEDNVAFLVNRSELYLLIILGIVSMGAVYVPLDDAHPDDRIKFILDDTESKVIIVSDETYERADNLTDNTVLLNISEILKEDIQTVSSLPVISSRLICILYTSGTTGIPKGVKITRKSIVNYVEYYVRKSGISHNDVFALYASIGFDVGAIKSIFVPMYGGACLDIIPTDIRLDMNKLNNYFNDRHVTHAHLPTQVAKLFIKDVDNQSLDVLCTGGEKLGEITYSSDYLLIDSYGPTEACVSVTAIKEADKIDSSSIGYLLDNLKAYVLDDEFRRVPVGAVGELYLAGIQIADGYLNREEETSNAFLNNPFDNEKEFALMYRTGDMVRVLPDKSLAIIGRQDGQVKIRGNRLELTEVESIIREINHVDDVTVQTIKHGTNNELVAYVVVNNEMDGNELKDSICDYVNKYKPDYMLPSFVMKLDEIPLNVNGKVDKRALPDVDMDSLHVEYVAPRDENEKEIVKAFEKALNLDKISIYDDFIRLGGDSLKAINLLNYIESDDVTMADIFTFRTPEAIAKNMSDLSFDLDIYSLEEGCPLNSAQINVFADVNIYNKVNAYHIPGHIQISKEYGLEKIMDSLDEIINRHPILSTHLSEKYEVSDNNVTNYDLIKDLITTAKKFGIKEIMNIIKKYGIMNVTGLYKMLNITIKLFKGEYPYLVKGNKPQISVESKFDRDIITDFFAESFNLYNYLSKFMIVESEESYHLFYMIHHIIFDAVSAGVFKRDFMTLLEEGNIEFEDTFLKSSAFTHQIKNTEKFDEANEFYKSFLTNLDDVGILLEDNPSSEGYNISSYDLEFDKQLFKSFLSRAGISENVLFTSVFSYALSQFVNGNKVIFTMIENGRDRFQENFIGMTSNVMPLVIDCKDQSINSFMEDVSDTVYGVLRHSYYPILLLYQKYNFEVNILFQFVPNWIADDSSEGIVSIEGIDSEEVLNYLMDNFNDYITEFFVQVYQNGDDYTLFITHSKKYSDKLVEDFKDIYISILYNIINADISSNMSDTLNSL